VAENRADLPDKNIFTNAADAGIRRPVTLHLLAGGITT